MKKNKQTNSSMICFNSAPVSIRENLRFEISEIK